MHALMPKQLVGDKYLIESVLGRGNMGEVFRASHVVTGRVCAVKVPHADVADEPELVKLFLREARVGTQIGGHPHLVEVYDAGVDPLTHLPYMVMEFVEGIALDAFIGRHGALPTPLIILLVRQLASALEHAHARGVVHRDLKPANIFLQGSGMDLRIKLADFGIAKVLEQAMGRTSTSIGTPAYAAPEQLGRDLRVLAERHQQTVAIGVSPQTDIWALGLVLYEMFTGHVCGQYWDSGSIAALYVHIGTGEFAAPSSRAGAAAIRLPRGFDDWFLRCLQRDSTRRWPSASHAVDELIRIASSSIGQWPSASTQPMLGPPPELRARTLLLTLRDVLIHRRSRPSKKPPRAAWLTGRRRHIALAAGATGFALLVGTVLVKRELRAQTIALCKHSDDKVESCEQACLLADGASCAQLGWTYYRSTAVEANTEQAPRYLSRACDLGYLDACADLGWMYLDGVGGLTQDLAAGAHFATAACDGGSMHGCAILSSCYALGLSVERDGPRAIELSRKSCDAGSGVGCSKLASYYELALDGGNKEPEIITRLYQRACDLGDAMWGCAALGMRYAAGMGSLEKNPPKAFELLNRSCDARSPAGCYTLASLYLGGFGEQPIDHSAASRCFRFACQGGHAGGCAKLGEQYRLGQGVAQDYREASRWFSKACNLGSGLGCASLGQAYALGQGVEQDIKEATRHYQIACQAGDANGCNQLGRIYEEGSGDVAADPGQAATLFGTACHGGVLEACNSLGTMYAFGRGIQKDRTVARDWFAMACSGGYLHGCCGQADIDDDNLIYSISGSPARLFRLACDGGLACGCAGLSRLYGAGHGGVAKDVINEFVYRRKACDLGWPFCVDLF